MKFAVIFPIFLILSQFGILVASEVGPSPMLMVDENQQRCQLINADDKLIKKNRIVARLASVMVYGSNTRTGKDKDGNEILFPINQQALIFRVQEIISGEFKGICYVVEVVEESRPDVKSPWKKNRNYTLMTDGDFWASGSIIYIVADAK